MSEVEDAYNLFWDQSKASPDRIFIQCSTCRESFELIRGNKNQVCPHLKKELGLIGEI